MAENETWNAEHIDFMFDENSNQDLSAEEDLGESDDLQSHTLLIREGTEEKMFACLNCKLNYASALEFKRAHNIDVEQQVDLEDESEFIEEPLWETVPEDVPIVNEEDIILEDFIEDTTQENFEENEETYSCLQCGVSFKNLTAAQTHVCEHLIEDNDSQDYVDITDTVLKLNEQISLQQAANEAQQFTCEICNISFSAERYLNGHRKIHNERPTRSIEQALPAKMKDNYPQSDQFYCEICDKSFDSNLLFVHKNMHLSTETSENTCSICNRDFFSAESYEMHMKVHAGKLLHKRAQTQQSDNAKSSGRFKCQYCDKCFKRPYEKLGHERVHTGEKPYACEVCGKRFRVSYSLTMHLRTHTDVRPFKCEVCHKRFKSQPVFAHHKRTHSTERNFECEICQKTFQTAVQLSAHRNSHSKPFQCNICKHAFAALYLLRSHMQAHQSEAANTPAAESLGLFKCDICGAAYMRELSLRQHIRKHHNSEPTNEFSGMDMLSTSAETELDDIALEPEQYVDEQSALLIAVANAAEQFEQERCLAGEQELY